MQDWQPPTDAPDSVRERGYRVSPFSERCAKLLDQADHALIGISPGNGYFSDKRIASLMTWAASRFTRFDVVYPDEERVTCTYVGRGYTEQRAAKHAHRDVRQTQNRISRALEALPRPHAHACQVRMYPSDFHDVPAYRQARQAASTGVESSPHLREVCENMVHEALTRPADTPQGPDGEHVDAAMEYLKAELPFFTSSPDIFQTRSSVVAYRATPPFAHLLYTDEPAIPVSDQQGFVQLEQDPAASATHM